ncbi:unnamed protein product [Prorocentrum cordatum]|uniref:Uncharacterized protein n=1 Tax=Prorocentrum cordatum TaxID=2364126 RepID=A0ABN9UQL2_9DINO|nr:unnamed protein product [Polarella glacialis]
MTVQYPGVQSMCNLMKNTDEGAGDAPVRELPMARQQVMQQLRNQPHPWHLIHALQEQHQQLVKGQREQRKFHQRLLPAEVEGSAFQQEVIAKTRVQVSEAGAQGGQDTIRTITVNGNCWNSVKQLMEDPVLA